MNFDRIAAGYDALEWFTAGARLERARRHWLQSLAHCKQIVSLGEGHGRFAAACLAGLPRVQLTCVESSEGMARVARRRLRPWEDRVQWVREDVLHWSPPRRFDAVVTCFFLDCFEAHQLARVIDLADSACGSDAFWLNVDFALPTRGWRRMRARAIHALMYRFFRVVTRLPARRLIDPAPLLTVRGFALERSAEFEWGLVRADLWRRQSRSA